MQTASMEAVFISDKKNGPSFKNHRSLCMAASRCRGVVPRGTAWQRFSTAPERWPGQTYL
jgi:hypothetical protein